MAASQPTNTSNSKELEDKFKQLQLSLPKQTWFGNPMTQYQGFWFLDTVFEGMMAFQAYFEARDTDIILASMPKTGTTWLKSILFAIVNRKNLSDVAQNLFNKKHLHELVPHFEYVLYNKIIGNQPNLTGLPSPRLFATHMSYLSLPESIKTSNCRIIYICRNPLDTFVSSWHFFLQYENDDNIKTDSTMMEEYILKFCQGVSPFGPYDNHVLGYWKESMGNPNKVLFLEYEGLKKEPKAHLKRLAEFVGYPFTKEEEEKHVIEEIIELCSIKSLKEKEVNKNGRFYSMIDNKAFFRNGEIGDWSNHLTPSMVKHIDETLLQNLKKAGYSQSYYPPNI